MWFGTLVAALLALRGALMWYIAEYGGNHFQPDSELYVVLARNLAEQGWFSASADVFIPEVFRTPGYPAFLALLQLVGVDGPTGISVVQEIVYLLCVLLAYLGIRRLLTEHLARAALVFMLLEPGGLAFPKLVGTESLFLPFVLGAVFTIGFHLRDEIWRWALLSGVLLGVGVLVRPAATYLPVVFLLVMWLARKTSRGFVVGSLALILGFSVAIAPWLIRNAVHFGQPFLSGQASNLLAHFHVPAVWETTEGIPFEQGQALVRERIAEAEDREERVLGRALNAAESFRLRQDWAVGELFSHLPTYAMQWGFGVIKAVVGVNLLELYHVARLRTDRLRYYEVRETRLVPKALRFLSAQDPLVLLELVFRALVAVLAVLGAWAMLRSKDPFLWLLLGINAYFLSIAGPMGYGRLRFPVEVFWFLQGALGFGVLSRRFGWLK